jgi:hypothetical protein
VGLGESEATGTEGVSADSPEEEDPAGKKGRRNMPAKCNPPKMAKTAKTPNKTNGKTLLLGFFGSTCRVVSSISSSGSSSSAGF